MSNSTDNVTLPCECAKGGKQVEKYCKISETEKNNFKKKQDKINDKKKKYNKKHKRRQKEIYAARDMTWKDKHCGSVMFNYELPDTLAEGMQNITKEIKDIEDVLTDHAKEMLKKSGMKKAERILEVEACAVLGGLLGGAIGFFFGAGVSAVPAAATGAAAGEALCGGAAVGEGVVDTAKQAKEIYKLKKEYWDKFEKSLEKINNLKKVAGRGKKIKSLKDLKGILQKQKKKLTNEQKEKLARLEKEQKDAKKLLYDAQEIRIKKDKCLSAKRCELKSFTDQNKGQKSKAKKLSPKDQFFGLSSKDGCSVN